MWDSSSFRARLLWSIQLRAFVSSPAGLIMPRVWCISSSICFKLPLLDGKMTGLCCQFWIADHVNSCYNTFALYKSMISSTKQRLHYSKGPFLLDDVVWTEQNWLIVGTHSIWTPHCTKLVLIFMRRQFSKMDTTSKTKSPSTAIRLS